MYTLHTHVLDVNKFWWTLEPIGSLFTTTYFAVLFATRFTVLYCGTRRRITTVVLWEGEVPRQVWRWAVLHVGQDLTRAALYPRQHSQGGLSPLWCTVAWFGVQTTWRVFVKHHVIFWGEETTQKHYRNNTSAKLTGWPEHFKFRHSLLSLQGGYFEDLLMTHSSRKKTEITFTEK